MAKKNEPKKIIKKVLDIPLYRGYFQMVLATNEEDVAKLIDANIQTEVFACTYNHDLDGDDCYSVVFNPDRNDVFLTFGDIAHEAVHAAGMLFESRGILAAHDNDEALAYMVGWFTNEIIKFLEVNERFVKLKTSHK